MGMQLHKTIILSSCKLQLVQLVVIETIYMLALCDQLIFFFGMSLEMIILMWILQCNSDSDDFECLVFVLQLKVIVCPYICMGCFYFGYQKFDYFRLFQFNP